MALTLDFDTPATSSPRVVDVTGNVAAFSLAGQSKVLFN
ncbi:MAG: hypothetical protein ACI8WT_002830 [Clostridium sp.]|jgi:hypothetical protein